MTRIHNGPARNQPKGARTRAELAAATGQCICPGGRPTTVARFEAEQLVAVELRHRWDCGRRSTYADPRDYLTRTN